MISTIDVNPSQLSVYAKNTNGDEFAIVLVKGNIIRLKLGRKNIQIG